MNRPHSDDTASFEHEWALQERALRAEREAAPPADDTELAHYRRIAHALRTPVRERLPSNFAYVVASLAEARARAAKRDLRFERGLLRVLGTLMALGALGAAAYFGAGWLAASQRVLDSNGGEGAGGWLLAATACVLLTWGMQGWRRWRSISRRD